LAAGSADAADWKSSTLDAALAAPSLAQRLPRRAAYTSDFAPRILGPRNPAQFEEGFAENRRTLESIRTNLWLHLAGAGADAGADWSAGAVDVMTTDG
jgi:hypothetical protein